MKVEWVEQPVANAQSAEAAGSASAPIRAKAGHSRLAKIGTNVLIALATLLAIAIMALTIGPRFLGYQVLTVLSGSMEPTIQVGALVVLVPADGADLQVGDVITFNHPERPNTFVTHRIYKVVETAQGRSFITKGDANGVPDAWVVNASGKGWRYLFNIPQVGYWLAGLASPLFRFLLFFLPTALFGGIMLLEIWRPRPVAVPA